MGKRTEGGTIIELNVNSRPDGDATLISVSGEVDLSTTPLLRSALVEHLDAGRKSLVLDLSEVGFLDSTGLGMLVSLHRRANDEGGSLRLTSVQRPVRRVLQITGLEEVFGVNDPVS